MTEFLMLLAQDAANGTGGGQPGGQGQGAPPQMDFWRGMFPLLLMMGVFFFFIMWSQRKERQKFAQMLASIKRNDKVQTVGGVIGTVVEVRDDELVLKVDENSNTKIRFARSAIKHVLSNGPAKQ